MSCRVGWGEVRACSCELGEFGFEIGLGFMSMLEGFDEGFIEQAEGHVERTGEQPDRPTLREESDLLAIQFSKTADELHGIVFDLDFVVRHAFGVDEPECGPPLSAEFQEGSLHMDEVR